MDQKTANQIINEAIDIAFKKGCYGLIEATNIAKAIAFINTIKDENNATDAK
jgi:hypothetical protein